MIRVRVRRVPIVTALSLIATAAGIDPGAFWKMTARELFEALKAAYARKSS